MALVVLAGAASLGLGAWRMLRPTTERLMADARLALSRHRTSVAVQKLDAVLRRAPSHGLARLYRGQIAREAGELDEALRLWSGVADEPALIGAQARYLQGTLHLEQGRAREAESSLRRAASLNPEYLAPHERLLELSIAQMRRESIRDALLAISRLRTWKVDELVMYTVAGERVTPIAEGLKLMRQFTAADPDDLVSGLALARFLSADDREDEALEGLERLEARFPADERIPALRAEGLLGRRDAEGAAAILSRHPLAGTSHVWLWQSYGRHWLEAGHWQNAADCLLEVAARDPENLPARYQLGTALARLGRDDEALVHLTRAELLDKLQREALRIPRRDSRQAGVLVPVVLEAARLLIAVERYPEALWWYEQALALDSQSAPARQGLARAGRLAGTAAGPTPPSRSNADLVARRVRIEPARGARRMDLARASPAAGGRIRLRDVAQKAGLDFQYFSGQTGLKYLVESMGGAAAVLDYDGDGWPDLYFPQGCRLPYDPADRTHLDRLFRNRGDGTFEDATAKAGLGDNRYGQGCAVGDYDNDGDPDLFVANFGQSVLYRNNGDGTFVDATQAVGVAVDKWSSSAAFADLDRDGNLDLYIVTYVDSLRVCRADDDRVTTCDPQNFNAEQDVLYRGRGDGTMEDISADAGILAPDGKGLGIVIADLDGDDWPDIYVANDGTPNFLFHNLAEHGVGAGVSHGDALGGPRFREQAMLSGAAVNGEGQAQASMGIASGDLDGDRRPDLFVTNFYLEGAALYLNQGAGIFQDATRAAGLEAPTKHVLGFGTQAIDFDRDGWPDLVVANGHIDDYRFRNEPWKMPPQLFQNLGSGRFADRSRAAGEYFDGAYLGRGVARLDWNRDGLADAVVVHQDRPVALLENQSSPAGRGLVFELHGVESNRDAIGARLAVTAGGRQQISEICGGDGFFCSNERRQFVGVGAADRVNAVEVQWPSGLRQRFSDVPVDGLAILVERGPLRWEPFPGQPGIRREITAD